MNRKKVIYLLLILLCFIPTSIFADMGPKPRTTIIIENPPQGQYYIDLLMEKEDYQIERMVVPETCEGLEKELLEIMLSYEDEQGWRARYDASPVDDGITPNNLEDTYTFRYMAVPNDFKIIIVTSDKKVHVSSLIHKHAYEETMYYDYATDKVRQKPLLFAYAVQFMMTCLPTLLIEGILLILMGFKIRNNGKVFLLTNIGTQLLMTIILATQLRQGALLLSFFYFILVEIIIMVIECNIYKRRLVIVGKTPGYCVCYGVLANLASALAGFLSIGLQYELMNR